MASHYVLLKIAVPLTGDAGMQDQYTTGHDLLPKESESSSDTYCAVVVLLADLHVINGWVDHTLGIVVYVAPYL